MSSSDRYAYDELCLGCIGVGNGRSWRYPSRTKAVIFRSRVCVGVRVVRVVRVTILFW